MVVTLLGQKYNIGERFTVIMLCVCFFSHSFWTSSSLDVPAGVTQEEGNTEFCGACLNFSREKNSAIPFPRRPWSRILCTNDLIVLHSLGIFFLLLFSEKYPVYRDRTHVPTCQKVTRLPLSYRGDRRLALNTMQNTRQKQYIIKIGL